MLKNILFKTLEILQITFCSLLFSWIIYLRLFRWGSFREVATNLLLNEDYFRLVIIIDLIGFFSIILVMQLRALYEIESKWKFTFLEPIIEFVDDTFAKFWSFLNRLTGELNIGPTEEEIIEWGLFISRKANTLKKLNFLIYMVYVWPRFVYIIIFIIDVFVFHQFYYVFKFGWLLLIPFFMGYIEKLYGYIIEYTYDILETIFFIVDKDTKKEYTLREYFSIIFYCHAHGVQCPIKTKYFQLHASFVDKRTESARLRGVDEPDFGNIMKKYCGDYNEKYFPLNYFLTFYTKAKIDITTYTSILFTISYLVIWTSLLIITI